MSVVINVEQSPLTITPSNGEHVYTLSSSGYTLTNFKFILDVYFQPDQVVWSGNSTNNRVARLKVRPNSYGKAIIELEEIVRTLLKANPRFSGSTYPYLNFVAQENSIITLSDAQETRDYNAFNTWGNSPNGNLEVLWHVEKYRAIVGCEYENIDGSITEDIDRTASFQPNSITIFPGVDNTLIPEPYLEMATLGSGYTQSPNFFQVDNQTWYYYDLFRHFYSTGSTENCNPKEFLNAGGRFYRTISQPGFVNSRVRRRQHHIDCPIIVSFLNGKNDYFTNDIYSIGVMAAQSWSDPYTFSAECSNRSTTSLPTTNEPINSTFRMLNFYVPYNITSGNTLNAIPTDSRKLIFYGTSYNANQNNRLNPNSATTEILEFYIQDNDCINEPIHMLFLNSQGMWDTYTFGKKSQKTINIERLTYQQEASLNKQFYTRGANQRGKNIYEQNVGYQIQCASWYMDENDTEIVEELFLSPEVYIITGTTIDNSQCQSCLNEVRLYQHLIPVVIKETSFQVYKKQYQKIFQYQFTLEYSSVKRYRAQG